MARRGGRQFAKSRRVGGLPLVGVSYQSSRVPRPGSVVLWCVVSCVSSSHDDDVFLVLTMSDVRSSRTSPATFTPLSSSLLSPPSPSFISIRTRAGRASRASGIPTDSRRSLPRFRSLEILSIAFDRTIAFRLAPRPVRVSVRKEGNFNAWRSRP